MKEFWDTRYETEEFVYGKEPNRFLSGELIKMKPGRILLPGEGDAHYRVNASPLCRVMFHDQGKHFFIFVFHPRHNQLKNLATFLNQFVMYTLLKVGSRLGC